MPAPADVARALGELGAATLGESGGRPMRARIRAAWPGARLAAPAYPVRCTTGDNLAIHVAVARAPAGTALVVDVGAERDVDALAAHGFPVFATTVALPGATKKLPGTIGAKAVVGGVDVAVGDWVIGDADGVTVVAAKSLDKVLKAGRARADKEAQMFEALRSGSTTLDLLSLDASPVEER